MFAQVRSWATMAAMWMAITISASGQTPARPDSARRRDTAPGEVARHSQPLTAVQLLEYRPIGADSRVRFEWERVPGAREYRLLGRWTGPVSWTMRAREYRVTSRTATTWTAQGVTFEAPLPPGNHSWRLLAVFGPHDVRAVGDSTPLAFAVK